MAYVPLTVLQTGITLWQNTATQLPYNFISPSAASVDVSGWYSITLFVFAVVNGENYQFGTINLTGAAAYSAPTTTFSITNALMTALNSLPNGAYSYVIEGKPSSGDDDQAIVQGSLTLQAPAN